MSISFGGSMELVLHQSQTRGHADHGWLKSHHSFSFANYFNPERMGFGLLRVINDDIIAPSRGFGTHPHQNMEIISVPIYGELKHKDTMGNEYVIRKGEIQAMSAGSGVAHSEFNNSLTEHANFLQIWVLPKEKNINPRYSQKEFDEKRKKNQFQLIVSPSGEKGSVAINQDAYFSLTGLDQGHKLVYSKYKQENGVYFFVIKGNPRVADQELRERDGLGVTHLDQIEISALEDSEILIMEVPMLNE